MNDELRVLKVATSYPRSDMDWQGTFIRNILNSLSSKDTLSISLWAPSGPLPENTESACSDHDQIFLKRLTDHGGIAHLIRRKPVYAAYYGARLLAKLRKLYTSRSNQTDIFHINWLQNAIPLIGLNKQAVITVLGTDYQLVKNPLITWLIRKVLKTNNCVITPNAEWMVPLLQEKFGDLCPIKPVNFGIDDKWFNISSQESKSAEKWLCIQRITHEKMASLFEWGESIFSSKRELHLFGPKQDNIDIPEWVHYHGAIDSNSLANEWFPSATGYITLSQHTEGKPQILLEAMASGLIPIVSNIAAHKELVKSGETGYIVENRQDLLEAFDAFDKSELKYSMRTNCINEMHKKYGLWTDCANRYSSIYEQLLTK